MTAHEPTPPESPRPPRRLRRLALHALLWCALGVLFLWCFGAVRYAPLFGGRGNAFQLAAAIAFSVLTAALAWKARSRRARVFAVLVPCLGVVAAWCFIRPSNSREWSPDQERPPHAVIDGDTARIINIRSCAYRSTTDFDLAYREDVFDLRRLTGAWLIVEPFDKTPGAAHTMLSFDFDDGRSLAVSVEVRRERGESYSPLRGLYRNYEIMYVIGDESDLVALRAVHRGHEVFMYPIQSSPTRLRAMFLHILDRCNALLESPEFYNTLTNTCTTAIMDHANRVSAVRVPWALGVILPAHADRLAYSLGLIPDDVPFEILRQRCLISDRARAWPGDVDFSAWIRARD